MKMLKALKSLKYNTRRLQAGDTFEARDRHAQALVVMKKAELIERKRGRLPRPPKTLLARAMSVRAETPARAEAHALSSESAVMPTGDGTATGHVGDE